MGRSTSPSRASNTWPRRASSRCECRTCHSVPITALIKSLLLSIHTIHKYIYIFHCYVSHCIPQPLPIRPYSIPISSISVSIYLSIKVQLQLWFLELWVLGNVAIFSVFGARIDGEWSCKYSSGGVPWLCLRLCPIPPLCQLETFAWQQPSSRAASQSNQ